MLLCQFHEHFHIYIRDIHSKDLYSFYLREAFISGIFHINLHFASIINFYYIIHSSCKIIICPIV